MSSIIIVSDVLKSKPKKASYFKTQLPNVRELIKLSTKFKNTRFYLKRFSFIYFVL